MRLRDLYVAYGLMVAWFVGAGLLAWAVDPGQFFRPSRAFPAVYSDNPRLRVPALARSHEFDAVIVGSSTASGMRADYLRPQMNAMRLALDGGTLNEATRLLRFTLRARRVRTVVWGVDSFLLSNSTDRYQWPGFVRQMLDGNPLWLVGYLYSQETTRAVWSALLGWRSGDPRDLDSRFDYSDTADFSRAALARAIAQRQSQPLLTDEEWLAAVRRVPIAYRWVVRDTVLRTIRMNPGIQFVIYFTPVSIHWQRTTPVGSLAEESALKAYLLEELAKLPNVRVLDYACDRSITFRDDVFADLVHYSPEVNRLIARDILIAVAGNALDRPPCTVELYKQIREVSQER
jgi:hypothetical protein